MSYIARLGEFAVNWNKPDLLRHVGYRPVGLPQAVRGAMNPWVQESQRGLHLAEEAAWKDISRLRSLAIPLYRSGKTKTDEFNRKLAEFEALTGQKVGGGGITSMLMMPINMLMMPLKMIGGLFGGNKKKKRAEDLRRDLERLQAEMVSIQSRLDAIHGQAVPLLQTSMQVKQVQSDVRAAALKQSSAAYATQHSARMMDASAHRVRVMRDVSKPSRQRGYDAL
ncbi:MAG: hypothetical protein ACRCZI_12285 [Cetobacterium sp.]